MNYCDYLAKYLGDLSKIVFGTVVVGQAFSGETSIFQLFTAVYFMLALLLLSLVILPEDK